MPASTPSTLPTGTAPDGAPSRRQAHKLRTERALQQAALELFARKGYDETTTDEIAEHAGVSPRTFFRYFATKEAVLFVGEYGWFQSFTKQFLTQPADLSDLEAIRRTLIALAPGLARGRRSLLLYEKAVASSPTLRGCVQDHQQVDIATTADAIATRRGLPHADDGCTILATVSLLVHRRALRQWLAGPASADPAAIIGDGWELLIAELNRAAPPSRRRRTVTRA